MEKSKEKTKRIFKNTLYMYVRMAVMMVISLFTARVVFNTLGVDDYGTYNVVASIIVFFSFLNQGLSQATTRYITADIADGNESNGEKTFNVCIQAHCIISAIVFLLAETLGLWCINCLLKIPEGREFAANVVFQISVISVVLNIIQSPFSSVIQAYEKMKVYAYFSVFDAVFKLLIVYFVQVLPGDSLINYAILVFCVSISNMILYRIYTFRTFQICHLRMVFDKCLLKDVFKFMSWSLLGQAAVVGTNQGAGVLVNVYNSVAANAAMGISNTITSTVNQFVQNFQISFRPQITKSYVTRDYDYLERLITMSSKISCFLITVFFVPILFEVENVLALWLGNYPQNAPDFCRWTLVCIFLDSISAPLYMLMYSQTNIRNYQIVISAVYSMNFFMGWLVFAFGGSPYSIIIVRACVYSVLLFIRLFFVKTIFEQFNISKWLIGVFGRTIIIILVSSVITGIVAKSLPTQMFIHVFVVTLFSIACVSSLYYFVGLSASERSMVGKLLLKKIKINND